MSNTLKISGAIKVGVLAADPSTLENGMIWYNSTDSQFKKYEAGAVSVIASGSFSDAEFEVYQDGDDTAKMVYDLTAVGTGVTRTITMPNTNVDLGLIASAIQGTEKGAVNGVASLDGGGKVPIAQLPSSIMEYLGTWNATTNTPTLADGTGDAGDVYIVSVAGTQDLGSGSITFAIGDWVIYNGSIWEKSINSNAVASVFGRTGIVTAQSGDYNSDQVIEGTTNKYYSSTLFDADLATKTTDNLTEGATNKYYTATQARSDIIAASIVDGDTTHAPSGDAVHDALALKLAAVSEDTTPSLGGNLSIGTNVVIHGADGMKLGSSAIDFYEQEYLHSTSLLASQTNTVISDLTFAHASFEGCQITYKIKEATTNNVRIGTLRVVSNGTNVSLNDVSTETADVNIIFDAVVNGANINIRYTSSTNAATMRCEVLRIKA